MTRHFRLGSLYIFLAFYLPLITTSSEGQALPAATRQAEYSVFVGGASIDPGFGYTRQAEIITGGDYTRFLRFFIHPGLELRASVSPKGSYVGERVFSGGPKISHDFGRFAPYVDLLFGTGVITYASPVVQFNGVHLRSDNSVVYTYGGGMDVALTRRFSARVDFQGSHWKLAPGNTFMPNEAGLALVWHTK